LNRSLQVVTNSLPIAHLLSGAPHIELVFVGGLIFPRTAVALGPLALQALGSLHVNKAFMGVAGIDEVSLYNANLLLVESELQMMRCADEVIILADRSKFGRRGIARLSGWEPIDRVVTDDGLDAKWQEVVRAAGAELVLAEAKSDGREPRTENRELRTVN
jgi:DeoR/GlpR family transcriptional regulator of sugar metabolism